MKDQGHPGNAPPVTLQLTNPDTKKACNAKVSVLRERVGPAVLVGAGVAKGGMVKE
jgi:hypothetical protein